MKAIGRLFLTLVLLSNLALLAGLSFHVVRAGKSVRLLSKDHLTLIDTYNDVSNWTPEETLRHPLLIERAMATGHADWFPGLAAAGIVTSADPSEAMKTIFNMTHGAPQK